MCSKEWESPYQPGRTRQKYGMFRGSPMNNISFEEGYEKLRNFPIIESSQLFFDWTWKFSKMFKFGLPEVAGWDCINLCEGLNLSCWQRPTGRDGCWNCWIVGCLLNQTTFTHIIKYCSKSWDIPLPRRISPFGGFLEFPRTGKPSTIGFPYLRNGSLDDLGSPF